jgi:hypothetical protein
LAEAFLRAAQRALIISESFFLPAAVRPVPLFLPLAEVAAGAALLATPPFLLAQRAFAAAESLARCEADMVRPFWLLPAPCLRAAQRAFIISESFFLPATVRPARLLVVVARGALLVVEPFLLAQRALAAAASFARCEADIVRPFRPRLVAEEVVD